MRCLCGKSDGYIVTRKTTQTPTTSYRKSGKQNGGVRVSQKASATDPGNSQIIPQSLKADEATRYSDTSKTVAQEYTQPETSSAIDEINKAVDNASSSKPQNGIDVISSKPLSSSETVSSSTNLNGALEHVSTSKSENGLVDKEANVSTAEDQLNKALAKASPLENNSHEENNASSNLETTTNNYSDYNETYATMTSTTSQEVSSSDIVRDSSNTSNINLNEIVEEINSENDAVNASNLKINEKINHSNFQEPVEPEIEILEQEVPSHQQASSSEVVIEEVTSSHSQAVTTHRETTSLVSDVSVIAQVEVTVSKSAASSTSGTPEGTLKRKPKAPEPDEAFQKGLESQKPEPTLLTVPSPSSTLSRDSSVTSSEILQGRKDSVGELLAGSTSSDETEGRRRSGVQVSVPMGAPVTVDEELPVFVKTPEDEENIKKAIEKNDFLSKILSGKRLKDIINSMQLRNVTAKKTLIKQGEKGSEMFVSKEGKYRILVKGKVVGEFSDTRVFGELAILYNAKRLATIQAITAGEVWVLDRHVYQKIVIRSNLREQDENLRFLQNVESLNVVEADVLRQVANLLKPEFVTSGTVIIRQGDKGDKFYIIRAGTVTISKTGEGVLGKLGKGQCFGEMALQKEDTRQATVTAEAPGVECLTLTRRDFIDHFGDVEIPKIEVKKASAIEELQSEYQDYELGDLKIIKTLGVGGFGRVELVQHKKHKNKVFALKYLKKIDIVYQNQQEHVYNEKFIQMNCRSPFIARLYRTYKDSKYVYFLMESCLGGDLFSLLHKQKGKRFDEKDAKFLSACVIEALEHLHGKEIVYRDLKPENLLIDKNGYLKLTDFGFAKKMPLRGKTFTFAGTPEYVAPEIVLNRGHDRAVDYWAFGAFVFELLTGRTPFRTGDSSHMRTYNKILNGIDNVNFPTYVNPKARNLIEKLCRPVPAERLGMQRGGPRDIKAHKWYQGFDWQKFQQCTIPSPFKPKLKDVIDTSHFDLFKQDKDYPPDENSGWDVHF